MSEKLRQCPFCGSSNVGVCNVGKIWFAYCDDCMAEGSVCDSKSDAMASWNLRKHIGDARVDVDALADRIHDALGVSK